MTFKISLRSSPDSCIVPTILLGCFQLSACATDSLYSLGFFISTDNFYSSNMVHFDTLSVRVKAFCYARYKRNDVWKMMFGLFNCFGFAIRFGDYCSSKRLCLGLQVWPPAAWAEAGVEEDRED
jgi:hypothetical protein